MTFYEEIQEKRAPDWPYPVNYGKENEVSADILIIGDGVDGLCHRLIKRKILTIPLIETNFKPCFRKDKQR